MSGLTGNNIIAGSSGHSTGYKIDQSLRFNDDDSPYLSRTPGSVGNRQTWTWSGWVKKGAPDSRGFLLWSGTDSSANLDGIEFFVGLLVRAFSWSNFTYVFNEASSGYYRDTSAWYHIVVCFDSTELFITDRAKIYVNGEKLTDTLEANTIRYSECHFINTTTEHRIGNANGSYPWDGYLAEVHFIDGTALTSASFGKTNEDTNQWVPIEYEGTYGTNGFYLNFSDSASLGADSSGNSNNFTVTNLAATDQVLDSPTNNYCTMNPLGVSDYNKWTFSEGNLKAVNSSDGFGEATFQLSSGKWYFEVDHTDAGGKNGLIIALVGPNDNYIAGSFDVRLMDGLGTGLYGVSIDMDAGSFATTLNGSASSSGSFTPQDCKIAFVNGNSANAKTFIANFGQDSSFAGTRTAQGNGGVGEDFYYTPPTGYKALNTDNLNDPSIALPEEHFEAVVYVGDGNSTQEVTTSFEPDLIWNKNRTTGYHNRLFDRVRGLDKSVYSNLTSAEDTYQDYGYPTATSSTSVTVGQGTDTNKLINLSNQNYVLWNWKADNTSGSSNTDGTITSTVSANTTAGFSIVSYTGNGSANQTVGHGLSVKPELKIIKSRSIVEQWVVTGEVIGPANYRMFLTSTASVGTASGYYPVDTSTTLGISGSNVSNGHNQSGATYIAYCFHSVEGYSKVGSYTGNGSTDGTFFYTGFRPAFIMFKNKTATGNWVIVDNKRNTYNQINKTLWADLSSAEGAYVLGDFTSNGFKHKNTSNGLNNSGQDYIYLAIAESPFKYSNAR